MTFKFAPTRIIVGLILFFASLFVPVAGIYKGDEKIGIINILSLYAMLPQGAIEYPLFILTHFCFVVFLIFLLWKKK
jgi:hypothetical protein